jgi:YbbR domain-containing protein
MSNRQRSRSETIGHLGRSSARKMDPQPPVQQSKKEDRSQRAERKRDPVLLTTPKRSIRTFVLESLLDNLGLKILSAILAITVFLLINTDREREIPARVGVSYSLPDDRILVSPRLEEVRVTIRGPWRRLRRFDERELERINIDLRTATTGDIAITKEMVTVPSGLEVRSVSPQSVRVVFDKRVEKTVEVSAVIVGQPSHGYVVSATGVQPASLLVRGPEGAIRALTQIRTQELQLQSLTSNIAQQVEVVVPDGVEVVGSPQVAVRVQIDEQLVTQRLGSLAVAVVGDGFDIRRVRLSNAKTDIVLTGPLLDVEKARATIAARVKLSATDIGKTFERDISVDGVPAGVGVKLVPSKIRIAVPR